MQSRRTLERVGVARFYILGGHGAPTDFPPACKLVELAFCEAPLSNREASSNWEASAQVGIPCGGGNVSQASVT